MHRCRWNECYRTVPDSLYMCHIHWFRVPRPLRIALWNGYRKDINSAEYLSAHKQIQEWVKEHHGKKSDGISADSPTSDFGG
jgi:hypothetical protein